ncbi:MAG: VanW family protein [Clostridia bacterium]|nr:VanW family protein [Clostridia bacterium]
MQKQDEKNNEEFSEFDKIQEVKITDNVNDNLDRTQIVKTAEIVSNEDVVAENKKEESTNSDNSNQKKNNEEQKIEKQKDDYSKKKKKIKIAIISGIVLLVLLVFSMIFALINLGNDKIISGVSINGIEVSGLSKQEAKGKLETIVAEKQKKDISVKYEDFESEISLELLETKYDIDKAVEEAYNIGRNSNIFANNYNILFTMIGKKNIDINVSMNDEQLNKTLKDISSKLPNAIKEPSFYIEEDELIITRGTKGIAVDENDTRNKLINILKDINKKDGLIDLKVYEKEPDEINIDEIYKEVHTEAKDAYYTKDPFQIYPEVNGVDFNVDEAKELLKEVKDEYTIKLTITKPEITVDQIGTEAFPDRLSIFTTKYDASNYNRTTNLRLACEKINGKVLLSGETFSYNKTVGERTIAAGYKDAAIYSGGKVVDGLGGGICQISSTLYNAVLMANLEIVERRNHQFVTSYLPEGRDATVVYGLTDFQFKNTRKYPVRVMANVKNGIATIEIYGIKEDEEYTISFDTRTVATLPFSTQYVEDSSLAPGEEVVEQRGHNGIQTETYITKSLDGKVVSRSLLSKDTYTPMQCIIRRGTGTAPAVAPVAEPESTPSPAPVNPETQPSETPQNPNEGEGTPTSGDNTGNDGQGSDAGQGTGNGDSSEGTEG